ncbi:hypothetical protein Btru_055646 [Bulinus truncatus]|nr:hypothetical protein Btru_055646 [Bulinus truncatus]
MGLDVQGKSVLIRVSMWMLVCCYAGMLVCWYAGIMVCWYVVMLVCWYAGMLVCWYVGMLVCWYAGMLECRYVGMLYPCVNEIRSEDETNTLCCCSPSNGGCVVESRRDIPQVDLVLLLDASTSIGPSNWKKEIQYVTDFIDSFSLGLDDVRFGAVMFNKYSIKRYDLKDHHNPLQAAYALKDIAYPDVKGTNTHLALNQVLSYEMFSEASGGRDKVEDVVVVLTDGRSGQPTLTQEEVDKLHAANITIIAVGIGKVNTEELSRMATKSMKVFSTENNQLRDYIKKTYAKKICDPPPEVIPCTNYTKADIVLLIDASTSIGPVNWQKQVKFASEIVHGFTVGPKDVLFGCVIFNRAPTKIFDLNTHTDQTTLSQSLLEIRYPNISGTNTHLGLSHIRTGNLFDAAAGGRDDARNLVIVMTDAASEAVLLKGSGVDMLSVGIGAINIDELIAMASDLEYVFRAQSYALLDYIERDLVNTTCESIISFLVSITIKINQL